jgi:hypothetical protein
MVAPYEGADMSPRPRRVIAVVVVLFTGLAVTGCAATQASIEPMAGNAMSAARSAELSIRLDRAGRTFVTTYDVQLGDMATQLAGTISQLEQTQAADAGAERTRTKTLAASRQAVDAIHLAQSGHSARAEKDLRAAADRLEKLAGDR